MRYAGPMRRHTPLVLAVMLCMGCATDGFSDEHDPFECGSTGEDDPGDGPRRPFPERSDDGPGDPEWNADEYAAEDGGRSDSGDPPDGETGDKCVQDENTGLCRCGGDLVDPVFCDPCEIDGITCWDDACAIDDGLLPFCICGEEIAPSVYCECVQVGDACFCDDTIAPSPACNT